MDSFILESIYVGVSCTSRDYLARENMKTLLLYSGSFLFVMSEYIILINSNWNLIKWYC
jgi:hypothetical protein